MTTPDRAPDADEVPLPQPLRDHFEGSPSVSRADEAALLLTVDQSGWPRVAMLSVGEIVVQGRDVLLAVWPNSRSTGNLERASTATLFVLLDEVAYSLRLTVKDDGRIGPLRSFRTRVEEVRADKVGYARMVSGIRFELGDREGTHRRWADTIAALREQI